MTVRLELLNGSMGCHREQSGMKMGEIPDRIRKLGQFAKSIKKSRRTDKKEGRKQVIICMEDVLCLEGKQKMKMWL